MKTNKEKLIKILQDEIELSYEEFKDTRAKTLEWVLVLVEKHIVEDINTNN